MHGLDDDGFHGRERPLMRCQELGDDSQDASARLMRRRGRGAHEPDAAAAIDQPQAFVGDRAAEPGRGGKILRARRIR